MELDFNSLDIIYADDLRDKSESLDNKAGQISNEVIQNEVKQNNDIVEPISDIKEINNENVSPNKSGKR